jgi:endonuclease/exonuclease/phosphatase family metal-dependent hydrolase
VEHARPLELPTLEPRGAVHVRLACDDAMPLDLFGVHLDLSGFRRRAQLRALLAIIADRKAAGPAVMLGDFNQWSRLRGAMRAFPDEWSQCDPGPSFPSRRPIARLDRIVVSGGIDIRSAHAHHSALSVRASDHLPIVARIALPKK